MIAVVHHDRRPLLRGHRRRRPPARALPLVALAAVVMAGALLARLLQPAPQPGPAVTQPAAAVTTPATGPSGPTSAATAGTKAASLSWLGVYTGAGGTSAAQKFESQEGAAVAWTTAFLTGSSGWSGIDDPAWYLQQWPAWTGLHMDWAIPIINGPYESLKAGAAGDYDRHFLNLAQAFVAAGQPDATFRLGWEMADPTQPWYAGKNPTDFAAYWRQIVTTMRSVHGQHFRFDWTGGGAPAGSAIDKAYPGDGYVDYITNDLYDASWSAAAGYHDNHASAAGHRAAWAADLVILKQLKAYGVAHHKPIGLPEWALWDRSDGHGGGDDPYFVSQVYDWVASTGNVAFAIYYDADNDGLHALYDGHFPQSAATWTGLLRAAQR